MIIISFVYVKLVSDICNYKYSNGCHRLKKINIIENIWAGVQSERNTDERVTIWRYNQLIWINHVNKSHSFLIK